jgi:ribosomal protein S18 acetylase RimI-like enzyme
MDKSIENIKIRPFKKEDFDTVAKIILYSFRSKSISVKSLSDEKMIQLFKDARFVESEPFEGYLVAEKDQEVVGVMLLKWEKQKRIMPVKHLNFIQLCNQYGYGNMIKLIIRFAVLNGKTSIGECYIEHIAVSSNFRGLGIGSMLINHANNIVNNSSNLNRITLYVSERNILAVKLYQTLGFTVKNKESSFLTYLLIKEKNWLYMVKNKDGNKDEIGYAMQSGWWLGFLGIFGFFTIPRVLLFLEGGSSPNALLGLLWFLWFLQFIPKKK